MKTVKVTLSYVVEFEVTDQEADSADVLSDYAVDILADSLGEGAKTAPAEQQLKMVLSSFDDIEFETV